jgi:hypothetical protein
MGRGLLIIVSGLVIITGIAQKSMSDRLQTMPAYSISYHQQMAAQNVANSLIEYGLRELNRNQDWEEGFSSPHFMGAEVSLQVFNYVDYLNGNPAIPANHSIKNWDKYTVLMVSKAQNSGAEAESEVAIAKDAFSKYTYFTDYEPDNIYFFSGDILEGPVHTNGILHIAGSPVFKGFVSSPNNWEGHPDYENSPQFEGGKNLSSPVKEMPGVQELDYLRNVGISGGLSFSDPIFVEFKNDGTVDISTGSIECSGWGPWEECTAQWNSPTNYDLGLTNGVISSSEKVFTRGVLDGKVTLHSAKEVEIMGDLLYKDDPRNNPNSNDLLGIVSEGDVVVDENAHQASGSKDLEVHASIMALGESFRVEDYNSGNPRGTLTLLGGLQQKVRGPVGTFGGGAVQSGFNKAYMYDDRMSRMIPPFYPRESIFSLKYWKDKPVEVL